MTLHFVGSLGEMVEEGIYLLEDSWNDWWKYNVTYQLYVVDYRLNLDYIGRLKIGYERMEANYETEVPVVENGRYQKLAENFFSVGLDYDYYLKIKSLGNETRELILSSLNDISYEPDIYQKYHLEDVMQLALLRGVREGDILGRFHTVANGYAEPTDHDFRVVIGNNNKQELEFKTTPNSLLPTNLHAIIGRNGVGKTHLLNEILDNIIDDKTKVVNDLKSSDSDCMFNKVIYVSFSAFDDETVLKYQGRDCYNYIGLKKRVNDSIIHKTTEDLTEEFIMSVNHIKKRKITRLRWEAALRTLETEDLFKNIGMLNLVLELDTETDLRENFLKMSSGHKIVLLTVTRLVEFATEKVLILMDEPELHLHPPLLSAFIRSISNLLYSANGVTIMATHSPVVLQEIPKENVYIIHRNNNKASVNRPDNQTFGESVGVLTRDVFGLEVLNTGFRTIIEDLVDKEFEFEAVIDRVGHLGKEADYLLRYLLRERKGERI